MTKTKTSESLLKGTAKHRRTEDDYMAVLLDVVTLNDWRDVVEGALQLAKNGDSQARAWLAQYLVGKPETKAPTPLTVVVQQLNGDDPVVERLTNKTIMGIQYPDESLEKDLMAVITAELAEKVTHTETDETP